MSTIKITQETAPIGTRMVTLKDSMITSVHIIAKWTPSGQIVDEQGRRFRPDRFGGYEFTILTKEISDADKRTRERGAHVTAIYSAAEEIGLEPKWSTPPHRRFPNASDEQIAEARGLIARALVMLQPRDGRKVCG